MQTAVYNEVDELLCRFIAQQRLPQSYTSIAAKWFLPVLDKLSRIHDARNKTLIVGINGCQGSGKSTLASFAVDVFRELYQKNAVALSIDDFYLTIEERKKLARDKHPLFLTRGVPGTHDLTLANTTITALKNGLVPVKVPRFDKAFDDRADEAHWTEVSLPVDVIILEGWCVGAVAQPEKDLLAPVNELEEFEDRSGIWRNYVNQQLANGYAEFFSQIDLYMMLKAPSFNCVYQWRLEQEEKLKQSLDTSLRNKKDYRVMSPQQIKRFIQYYQRVTEHNLETLPQMAQVVYSMDSDRQIVSAQDRL